MGEVYLARQINLGRHVAVKILRQEIAADEEVKQRFQREARLASQLGPHPNIVQVYEPGEHEGSSFFSMEFVDGKNLAEVVRDGPLPPREAAGHISAIAHAVHFAHLKGVIHRDLKPANILIDGFGRPRLTDFGMAKDFRAVSDVTKTHQIVGTINYMSPEQIEPRFGEVGPRSDVYSLGATLYQLLTGSPPFSSDSPVKTLALVTDNEPIPIKKYSPTLPSDLQTICQKCLQKTPGQRYASALELADDLTRFLEDQPIKAKPPNAYVRTKLWTIRNPWQAGAIGVAILAVLLGFGVVLREKYQLKQQVWKSLVSEAQAQLSSKNRPKALEAIRTAARLDPTAALRTLAIQSITMAGMRDEKRIPGARPEHITFANNDRWLVFLDVQPMEMETNGMQISSFGPSPEKQLCVWDCERNTLVARKSHLPQQVLITAAATKPLIAYVLDDSSTVIWNPTDDSSRHVAYGGFPRFNSEDDFLLIQSTKEIVAVPLIQSLPPRICSGIAVSFLSPSNLAVVRVAQTNIESLTWNFVSGNETNNAPHLGQEGIDAEGDLFFGQMAGFTTFVSERGDTLRFPIIPKGVSEAFQGDELIPIGNSLFASVRPNRFSIYGFGETTLIPKRSTETKDAGTFISLGLPTNAKDFSVAPEQLVMAACTEQEDGYQYVTFWDLLTGKTMFELPNSYGVSVGKTTRRMACLRSDAANRLGSAGPHDIAYFDFVRGCMRWPFGTPITSIEIVGTDLARAAFCVNSALGTRVGKVIRWDAIPPRNVVYRHNKRPSRSNVTWFDKFGWDDTEVITNWLTTSIKGVSVRTNEFMTRTFMRDVKTSREGSLSLTAVTRPHGFTNTWCDFALHTLPDRRLVASWRMYEGSGRPPWHKGKDIHQLTNVLSVLMVSNEPDAYLKDRDVASFSKDGSKIATAGFMSDRLQVRDTSSGGLLADWSVATLQPDWPAEIKSVTFLGNESVLLAVDRELQVVDANTGRLLRQLAVADRTITAVALTTDGSTICFGDSVGNLHLLDYSTARVLASWPADTSAITAVAFNTDSKILASGSAKGDFAVWDLPFIRQELARLGLDWGVP